MGGGASVLVGGEDAGDGCCGQERPGEFCVRARVEPANLDHVRTRFGWVSLERSRLTIGNTPMACGRLESGSTDPRGR
jgi:hypothetical protein